MDPLQLWLFNRPPVTLDEIDCWVRTHARISADDWRFYYYVIHWCVPEKIAAEKLARRQSTTKTKTVSISAVRPYPRKLLRQDPHNT